MCIGMPMQVVSCEPHTAICAQGGNYESVDVSLVGPQAAGTWLLVFLGAAREVMDPATARQTLDAVQALQQVMQGSEQIDHLFADLIDREPQLPDHLRDVVADSAAKSSNIGGQQADDVPAN